jgi:hypothetical protein
MAAPKVEGSKLINRNMEEECLERKRFNIFGFLQLIFFEEIQPNMLEGLSDLDLPLDESLEERLDGDIFVFQKKLDGDEEYRLPTCKDYFKHLFYQVQWGL